MHSSVSELLSIIRYIKKSAEILFSADYFYNYEFSMITCLLSNSDIDESKSENVF